MCRLISHIQLKPIKRLLFFRPIYLPSKIRCNTILNSNHFQMFISGMRRKKITILQISPNFCLLCKSLWEPINHRSMITNSNLRFIIILMRKNLCVDKNAQFLFLFTEAASPKTLMEMCWTWIRLMIAFLLGAGATVSQAERCLSPNNSRTCCINYFYSY